MRFSLPDEWGRSRPRRLCFAVGLLALGVLALSTPLAGAAPASRAPACVGDGSRVALLVGNQAYQQPMQELANPRSDVEKFSDLLCKNGFSVFKFDDLTIDGFDDAIDTFAGATKGAKTALIYYSGHGFAVGGKNWLVPTDAKLSCEDIAGDTFSPRLNRKLINLDEQVFSRIDSNADQIVILDACRTDPVKGCRGSLGLSLVKGLTREAPSAGRLIVYATQDGQVALDSVDGAANSPLMQAMTTKLADEPKKGWTDAMFDVADEVAQLTHQRQRPNLDISVRPQGCLASSCGTTTAQAPPPADATRAALPAAPVNAACADPETEYWRAAAFNTVDAYQKVIDECPNHPRKETMLIAIRKLVADQANKAKQDKDEAVWQDALKLSKPEALKAIEKYVEDNPDGSHLPEARQRIATLLADPELVHHDAPPPVAPPPPEPAQSRGFSGPYCVSGLKDVGPNNFLVLRYEPVRSNGGWDPDIRMFNGERLTVFGESGDFYHVRMSNGREGWSARAKIRPCDEVAQAAPAAPSPSRGGGCQVAGLSSVGPNNWLALRVAPSRTAYYPPEINMYNGTFLNVLDRRGEWYRVRTNEGQVGWASARFISCP